MKKRCVVVEDEFLISCFVSQVLKENGFIVEKVEETEMEGKKAILEVRPDFVVVDKNLKGSGCGLRMADSCRAQLNIPYFFISGSSAIEMNHLTQKGYPTLAKPFDEVELLSFIKTELLKRETGKGI